jgi:hypothetical protein
MIGVDNERILSATKSRYDPLLFETYIEERHSQVDSHTSLKPRIFSRTKCAKKKHTQ